MVDKYEMKLYIPEPNILTVCSSKIQEKLYVNINADKLSGNTHTQRVSPEYDYNTHTHDPGIFAKLICCAMEVKDINHGKDNITAECMDCCLL